MATMASALPSNLMHFVRILRRAGLPIGPGKTIVALEALQTISLTNKDDVYWALHATLVERHAQSEIFNLAFQRFWRREDNGWNPAEMGVIEQLSEKTPQQPTAPVARRIAEAFGDFERAQPAEDEPREVEEDDAVASWSASERLRKQDFETMTTLEMAEAAKLIARLRLPIPEMKTRRFRLAHTGPRIDMRATLRGMVRSGGTIELARKAIRTRHTPLVVLCDISGSMATYSRILLRFLHAITNDRDRVSTFLFGTRLTNITRELAHRDPDVALARIGGAVEDWGGGTRIGETLAQFNRHWSRRVLGQGAYVLLITDGLDRDGGVGLSREMERLHHSCRRLIWLNPLLRYAGFEPKSAGVRAMLPHVDEFRPVHNLDSLAAVVDALSADTAPRSDRHRALSRSSDAA